MNSLLIRFKNSKEYDGVDLDQAELAIKKAVREELIEKIEVLKSHPEMSDALAQDKLMHEYGHDNALTEAIKVIETYLK